MVKRHTLRHIATFCEVPLSYQTSTPDNISNPSPNPNPNPKPLSSKKSESVLKFHQYNVHIEWKKHIYVNKTHCFELGCVKSPVVSNSHLVPTISYYVNTILTWICRTGYVALTVISNSHSRKVPNVKDKLKLKTIRREPSKTRNEWLASVFLLIPCWRKMFSFVGYFFILCFFTTNKYPQNIFMVPNLF